MEKHTKVYPDDPVTAETAAVKEFMKMNIGYEDDKLENIIISETQLSKMDNIIYVAFLSNEDIKELHIRMAESRNTDLQIRDFIPPNSMSVSDI